jgi:hypothetical protein
MQKAIRTIKFVGISWIAFALSYGAFKFGEFAMGLFSHPSISAIH